jgi:predicted Zn finger-like uncharacterized protein
MSLATRCPACHTAFRVVQDQLRVSEGWVRCGRCNEVFNALDGLFDLERDPAPTSGTAAPSQARQGSPSAAVQAGLGALLAKASSDTVAPGGLADRPLAPAALRPSPQTRPSSQALAAAAVPADEDPATTSEVLDSRFLDRSTYGTLHDSDREHEFADARLDSGLHTDDTTAPPTAAAWTPRSGGAARSKSSPSTSSRRRGVRDEPGHTPGFLKQAERQARWRRPAVRAALSLVAGALLASLGLQWARHERDWLATQVPQTRPWLEQLCAWTDCRVGPWQSIQHVVVDNSSLTPGKSPESYRLTVQLRNRADVTLALPAVELALTDLQGGLVARRALLPADFRAGDTLPPRGEVTLRLEFRTPGYRVAGYTVEAFYP